MAHLIQPRTWCKEPQTDKIIGHPSVVLVHGVDHGVDQHRLVLLTQLRHVAKIHVRDAAIPEGEDVAGVRVTVEQAELQQLPETRAHAAADELVHIQPRGPDGVWVGAADAVYPLHDQHLGATQVAPHPGDLHRGVTLEVGVDVL